MTHRIAIALVLALATAAGLAAQTSPDPIEGKQIQGSLQVTGIVVGSEANRLIVKADNGQQMTFIVNDKDTDPTLFKVGDRVTASYVTLAGTGPVITKVYSVPGEVKALSSGTVTYSAPAPAPAPAPVETPAPVAAPEPEPVKELPQTASPLALVALIGFAAAAAARATRRLRDRK